MAGKTEKSAVPSLASSRVIVLLGLVVVTLLYVATTRVTESVERARVQATVRAVAALEIKTLALLDAVQRERAEGPGSIRQNESRAAKQARAAAAEQLERFLAEAGLGGE